MIRRAAAIVAAIAVAGALVALPATSGANKHHGHKPHAKKTSTVKVADDYFAPTKLKIKRNTKVKFKWDASNTDSHNVVLKKGPKGVKKGCKTKGKDAYSPLISKCNKSATGATGIKFKKKFDVKGKYHFICTIHPTVMQIDIKVKK